MAYAPNAFASTVPTPGNDDFIDGTNGIAANHNQVYNAFCPPVAEYARDIAIGASTDASLLRFRHRGNLDAQSLIINARVSGAVSPYLSAYVDSSTVATSGLIGADAWYPITCAPSRSNVHDVLITCHTAPAGSLTLTRMNAYLAPSAAAGAKRASGWIYQHAATYAADMATSVEHIDRWQNGPVHIALDRPVCVLSHLAQIKTGAVGKSSTDWCTTNVNYYDLVGRAILPNCYDISRRYMVDAYLARPSGTGTVTGSIQIGNVSVDITTVDAWTSQEVWLPPGPLPVRALIKCAASTSAQFDCVQIWRT